MVVAGRSPWRCVVVLWPPPPHLQTLAVLDKKGRRSAPFKIPVLQQAASEAFRQDYLSKVPNPMDLGTIVTKAKSQLYTTGQQFIDDVHLTFDNAMTYNGPTNDYHMYAA